MKKVVTIILCGVMLFSVACSDIEMDESSITPESEQVSDTFSVEEEGFGAHPESVEASSSEYGSAVSEATSGEGNVDYTESQGSSAPSYESSEIEQESETESNTASDSSTLENAPESDITVDSSTVESESNAEPNDSSSVNVTPQTNPDKVFLSNGVLISGTRGMEQYVGSENAGTKYCSFVSAFKNDLGDGINVYSIVAPHASCYYAPESYSHLITRGQVNFANLKNSTPSNVKYVDVYNTLAEHVDEDIYPRTEHHWNALAAYYAAEEFAKVAGVSFDPIDTYEKVTMEGFVGSLYAFSGSSVIKNNPEDFVIYKPNHEYTAYFCNEGNYNFDQSNYTRSSVVFDVKSYAGAFLGGDSVWVKIVTGNNTGRKLVIFKDSYGNAFVPFTVGSFDEIYVIDIRNYKRNGVDFCHKVGATDVAFVVSGFTATGVVYKNIEYLRTAY